MRSAPNASRNAVPHSGALCRLEENYETFYKIGISQDGERNQEMMFARHELIFAQRLFAILDTESRGQVSRGKVKEFTTQRCHVFWRRDDDLRKLRPQSEPTASFDDSPTFDEIWDSVVGCSQVGVECSALHCELGLEGWMVFCRFIALAQYLEAKRRFSARHLQQTMNPRNAPRGSEVVMVDVPPPEPPLPLSLEQMESYEKRKNAPLPLPELDLDHSLLAVHDYARRPSSVPTGWVNIDLFGNPGMDLLEFTLTFTRPQNSSSSHIDQTVVRRSMSDIQWLDDTMTSHKVLGGTLCGRILPPFPSSGNRNMLSTFSEDSLLNSSIKNTGGAIAVAAAGVGKIRSAAKSFFGSYFDFKAKPGTRSSLPTSKKKTSKLITKSVGLPESYYNPNSHDGKARQLERYLNYLLDHPALSTSFPLQVILTVSVTGATLYSSLYR